MELDITEKEFVELYQKLTYNELANRLGLSRNRIANLVKQLGLSKAVGRRKEQITFRTVGVAKNEIHG